MKTFINNNYYTSPEKCLYKSNTYVRLICDPTGQNEKYNVWLFK